MPFTKAHFPARLRAPLAAATAIAALILTGCATAPATAPTLDPLAAAGFEGQDIRQVVEELERTPLAQRREDLRASVRPDAVLFTVADGAESAVPLGEEFYLSVAPYVTETHECYFHSLTTCVGELGNQELEISVVTTDGEVLVDETRTAADNGFVGLWLPRDIEATLTITQDELSVVVPIATGPDDPTCLTDLRLSESSTQS